MTHYYNEFDAKTAAWLRELMAQGLIPSGVIDERSIKDVAAVDVAGDGQRHFFAGIAGWSEALRLAGWPAERSVWTGSCPCQPYSTAGKQKGNEDERDLWPDFYRLIRECRPDTVFGEQVPGSIKHGWLDRVHADLEREGYAVGHCVLGAHSVGSPHIRQRLYWVGQPVSVGVAHAESAGHEAFAKQCGQQLTERTSDALASCGRVSGVGHSNLCQCDDPDRRTTSQVIDGRDDTQSDDGRGAGEPSRAMLFGGVGQSNGSGQRTGDEATQTDGHGRAVESAGGGPWGDCRVIQCRDGKARRISTQRELFPLANGVSARVVQLRGYGNAIVPQVAAVFINAFLEAKGW